MLLPVCIGLLQLQDVSVTTILGSLLLLPQNGGQLWNGREGEGGQKTWWGEGEGRKETLAISMTISLLYTYMYLSSLPSIRPSLLL